jgi:hypothetical protein
LKEGGEDIAEKAMTFTTQVDGTGNLFPFDQTLNMRKLRGYYLKYQARRVSGRAGKTQQKLLLGTAGPRVMTQYCIFLGVSPFSLSSLTRNEHWSLCPLFLF